MTEEQALKLFKGLADRSRLQILKSLLEEDMYVERLAQRLELTPATVSFHLKKLMDAGAVSSRREQYYTMYSINKEVFQCRILDILGEKSSDAQRQQEREARYRQRVLDSFFEYGRLKAIPAQRKKERICLEEIAKELELGRPYPERELNQVLLRFHQDYCTLRRDMISEGILCREEGLYTRLV
ncbi:MAG: metalloregulator ArsR/SmtB family transcription factor [Acutalibacter sp.]